MRLVDMLAGRPSDNQDDKPSGQTITVDPSVSLLRSVDNCARAKGITREQALAAYAALGVVGEKAANGLLSALSERAREISSGKVDPRTQELRLCEAVAAKNALEDAAKACDRIAAQPPGWPISDMGYGREVAEACAAAIRAP